MWGPRREQHGVLIEAARGTPELLGGSANESGASTFDNCNNWLGRTSETSNYRSCELRFWLWAARSRWRSQIALASHAPGAYVTGKERFQASTWRRRPVAVPGDLVDEPAIGPTM